WRASGGSQLHRAAHMVNVRVRDHNLIDMQIVFANDGEDVFNVIAGIDDHPFPRVLIANDRAVALQRADGKDFVDHERSEATTGRHPVVATTTISVSAPQVAPESGLDLPEPTWAVFHGHPPVQTSVRSCARHRPTG